MTMQTFGTAAWKLKFFIGLVFVLIVDTAITCTSGRGRSFPKCSKILIPFLSYTTTGANNPEDNTTSQVLHSTLNYSHSTSHYCQLINLRQKALMKSSFADKYQTN